MPASYAMNMDQSYPDNETFFDRDADDSERKYTMINHLVGMANVFEMGILSAIASGVMWAVRKEESPYFDDHGREAFNFQLSLLLYAVVLVIFGFITFGIGFIISVPALFGLKVLCLIGTIRGGVAANRGEYYRYPMSIRFF